MEIQGFFFLGYTDPANTKSIFRPKAKNVPEVFSLEYTQAENECSKLQQEKSTKTAIFLNENKTWNVISCYSHWFDLVVQDEKTALENNRIIPPTSKRLSSQQIA